MAGSSEGTGGAVCGVLFILLPVTWVVFGDSTCAGVGSGPGPDSFL